MILMKKSCVCSLERKNSCFEDKRTRYAPTKFFEFDRSFVKAHINMISTEVGHYSRKGVH